MACKGCKSKKGEYLINDNPNKLKVVYKWLIFSYTILAAYGLISLILDIQNLFK